MALNILFTIVGIFGLVYLESILGALFGLSFFIILYYFLFRKVDGTVFLPVCAAVLLIFDVVYKLPLGSSMLMFVLPFGLYLLLSLFIALDSGILSFLIRIVIFWFYYIILIILPNLFVSGELGAFNLGDLLSSLLRAVLSVLVLLLLEYLYARFRKRGNTSQIRLK